MIPFKNRFHGHKSLMYVYRNGEAVRSRLVTMKFIANPHRDQSRFAVVVSKKVLKSAVRRNRIRRRVYELVQGKTQSLNGIYDIAFIITSAELINDSPADLLAQIDQFYERAGIQIQKTV